ncbi:MAG: penicillin acylase family protein [Gemmatales bacterium]|nr:penicillin acylase family protein [Gemmatales bacterium]
MPGELILATLAAAFAGAGWWLRRWWHRGLPQVRGRLTLPGLQAAVEVLRDRWGVPHIYAQNEADLFFAQGVVHAQDRLWQMELFRRLGHGRLSEIFGEVALSLDVSVRTLGFRESAQRDWQVLDEATQRFLERYSAGVNAMLASSRRQLPPEFRLLRYTPEPWQPTDTLVSSKVLAWGLSVNWTSEILHTVLVARLGADRAAELLDEYPAEHPIILHEQTVRHYVQELSEELRLPKTIAGWPALGALSNAWVVSGERSVSGAPLLAGDPHLSVQIPNIWYECHLVCPQWQAIGASIPGAPGIIIGHNEHIAWSVTAALADTQDLYWERLRHNGRWEAEYQGKWEAVDYRQEVVRVRGWKEPARAEVLRTRHGPIINALLPVSEPAGQSSVPQTRIVFPHFAVHHTGDEPSRVAQAVLQLNRARDWQEFREALRHWTSPAVCFVYADCAGNIGFQMAGLVPLRRRGWGQVPKPGWTDEYEWSGWIPFDELPCELNPSRGWIVSANHAMVGREYPYFLTREPLNGYRARRIVTLLQARAQHDLESFRGIQLDLYCEAAQRFCDLVRPFRQALLSDSRVRRFGLLAKEALQALLDWDCHLDVSSVGGTIYEVFQHYVCERLFRPWLGEWTLFFLGQGFHPVLNPAAIPYLDRTALVAIKLLGEERWRHWWRDEHGQGCERSELLVQAWADTLAYLRRRLGRNIRRWRWGRLHCIEFRHPLGARRLLRWLFNRGPYPYGGDVNTVWQASFTPNWLTATPQGFTPSYRQLLDLADWDRARAIHTTGQCGHPASRHYDDFIPMWLKGEYHPMLWSREKILEHLEGRLLLEPKAFAEAAR